MGKARGAQWARIDSGMPTHRKSERLARALRDPLAWAYVVALWLYSIRQNLGGELTDLSPEEIAGAAGWRGEPEPFLEALVRSGWVDRVEETGQLLIHEWPLYNGRYVEQQHADRAAARDRMRRRRALSSKGATPPTQEAGGTLPDEGQAEAGTLAGGGTLPGLEAAAAPCSPERSRARAPSRPVSSRSVGEVRRGSAPELSAEAEAAERADFERYWLAFPRRQRKEKTWQLWLETRGKRPPLEELLRIVATAAASWEWNSGDPPGRHRKTSWAFLADETWEDSWTPMPAAAAARGPASEPPIDVPARLGLLAAAVTASLDGAGAEVASAVLGLDGRVNEVEDALAQLDRSLLAAAELALSPDDRAAIDARVLAAAGRAGAGKRAHQVDDLARQLRRQAVRKHLSLPTLSLFSPVALGPVEPDP